MPFCWQSVEWGYRGRADGGGAGVCTAVVRLLLCAVYTWRWRGALSEDGESLQVETEPALYQFVRNFKELLLLITITK